SPSESRSPWSRLRIFDSCIAVAKAIVTARAGRPRSIPIAPIRAALPACSTPIAAALPDVPAMHRGVIATGLSRNQCQAAYPPLNSSAATRRVIRARSGRRLRRRATRSPFLGLVTGPSAGLGGAAATAPGPAATWTPAAAGTGLGIGIRLCLGTGGGDRLHCTGDGVAPEQQAGASGQFPGGDDHFLALSPQVHLRAGRHIQTRLARAGVPERDPHPGLGAR